MSQNYEITSLFYVIILDNMWQLLVAEATFVIEAIMFMLLFAGYWLAQEKKFIDHRTLMRYLFWAQTILNIIMIYSFIIIPEDVNFIPHMLIATPLYLLILYTFLLMEKKLPKKLEIPKIHRPLLMRITAVSWGVSILSGLVSFVALGM